MPKRTRFTTILAVFLLDAGAGVVWVWTCSPRETSSVRRPAGSASPEAPYLRDVAEEAGLSLENVCGSQTEKRFILEAMGSGAALIDYDTDGDLDLYIVNGASIPILRGERPPVRNALYRNDGGWRFSDVTDQAGVGDEGWGCGCAVGDIDSDGDPDLYVTNFGRNVLYVNLGGGRFREVADRAGVADDGWGASAAFGDIDNDGDLDLYLTNFIAFDIDRPPNGGEPCLIRGLRLFCGPLGLVPQADRLYRNDGTGIFEDFSGASRVHEPDPRYGLGVVLGDYDDDGWLDIYVANDSVPNFLFHNLGDGTFEELARLAGVATSDDGTPQAGMGVDLGDFNGDGRIDIVVTNFSDDYDALYENVGLGLYEDLSYLRGLGRGTWDRLGWGTKLFDCDNDGDLDLYIANGHIYTDVDETDLGTTYLQPDQLFLNSGSGSFVEASERIRISGPPRSSRGAAFGDLDNDGDIDVLVVEMARRPTLLENVGGNQGNWIRISLRGRRSNAEGAGARVRVTALGRTQSKEATRSGSYCSSNDPRVHFGLGRARTVDTLEVRWPGGKLQTFRGLTVNQAVVIDEERGIVEGG